MKKHAATIVLVVLALALGVWLWLDRDRVTEGERKRRENSAFVVWRRDELTRISIAHDGESIVLERDRPATDKPSNEGKEGLWRMTSPREERADPVAVERLLTTLEFATSRARSSEGAHARARGSASVGRRAHGRARGSLRARGPVAASRGLGLLPRRRRVADRRLEGGGRRAARALRHVSRSHRGPVSRDRARALRGRGMPTAASRSSASTTVRSASRSRASWRRARRSSGSGRRSPRCAPRRSRRTPTPIA